MPQSRQYWHRWLTAADEKLPVMLTGLIELQCWIQRPHISKAKGINDICIGGGGQRLPETPTFQGFDDSARPMGIGAVQMGMGV